MRTRAYCSCGWQRELSEFYAGKRIRCPDCLAIVDVPGESAEGLYNSALPIRPSRKARPGQWVPVGNDGVNPLCRVGNGVFAFMIVLFVIINGLHLLRPDPWVRELPQQRPVECTEPQAPCAPPCEEAAQPVRPAREYTPPAENEDEF